MENDLCKLIIDVKENDQEALLMIIEKFNLLIRKLSRKMGYEDAQADLIIYFIQLIKTMDLNKLKNFSEGGVVKYIQVSLNNKSIDYCKKYCLIKQNEKILDINMIKQNYYTNFNKTIEDKLLIDQLLSLKALTEKQKLILKYYYLDEYSDIQIGNKLKVTRQAVHKTRIYGLNILKNYVGRGYYGK